MSHISQTGKILYYVPVVIKNKREQKEDEPVFVILGILSKQMDDDDDDDKFIWLYGSRSLTLELQQQQQQQQQQ